jgi:hypothetical protein
VISNLYAWYDASAVNGLFAANPTSDGSALSAWKDLSGNGRDLAQATAAYQPLFRNASRNLLTYNQGATCEDGTTTGFGFISANSTINSGVLAGTGAVTTQAAYGNYSLAGGCITTAGNFRFGLSGATYIPVIAGNTYTALASIRAATTIRQARVVIRWLDSTFTEIEPVVGGTYANNSTSAWTDYSVTGTAPSNAVYGRLYVEIANAVVGEIHYADKFGLFNGTVSTWVPPVTLLNNLPTVQFDGSNDSLSNTGQTIARGSTIYIVKLDNARLSTGTRYYFDSSVAGITQPKTTNDAISSGGSAAQTAVSVGSGSVNTYDFSSTSMRVYVNGSAGTAGGAATSDFNRINIGSSTSGASPSASIFAVLIYSAAHDTTTRQSIERWLGAKYGITVA